jgi:hypothetical protein
MLNCRQLSFSQSYSQKRIALANKILGTKLVKRIIGLSLYLLGAGRKSVAEFIEMPYDTFKSFTERVEKNGAYGFLDRREKNHVVLPDKSERKTEITVSVIESFCIINFGEINSSIQIPIKNSLQVKVVLLSLLKNKIIRLSDVSKILNYSESYISRLAENLYNEDMDILLDHRQGQKMDYVFNSEIKSEVILQIAGNAVVGKSTSSTAIAEDLEKRKGFRLSARSIRQHISRLGLKEVSKKLPSLIYTLKKTQKNSIISNIGKTGSKEKD